MPALSLTTQQLEYLLAVDRHDTWSDAAASLGVSTSALSQGVAELERRLGVALFERDGRRRVPTADHAQVLDYAERTLSATADLADWLRGRHAGTTGSVRVGMIDAAATHHYRDVLRTFRQSRPELALHLTVGPSGSLLRDLQRAEIDLAVCVQPAETPPGVETTPILDDPLSVLAPPPPPGSGDRAPTALPPAQWGPWVSFPAGAHTRSHIEAALGELGASFEVVAESHQPEVLREMVLLGIGWSVLPTAGLGGIDDLVVVHEALTHRRLVVARRQGTAPNTAADALANALIPPTP